MQPCPAALPYFAMYPVLRTWALLAGFTFTADQLALHTQQPCNVLVCLSTVYVVQALQQHF